MFAKFVKNSKLISSKQGFVESYATGLFPYPFYILSIHQKICFSNILSGNKRKGGTKWFKESSNQCIERFAEYVQS